MRGLPRKAKGALEKARDSALLAVEVYNKPAVKFKSGGYINLAVHARCWKRFKVRPTSGSNTPQETNWKFCIYDQRHNDYGYTQAWADFLIEKLKDPTEFDAVCKRDQASD